jgi:putative acetyltransferase
MLFHPGLTPTGELSENPTLQAHWYDSGFSGTALLLLRRLVNKLVLPFEMNDVFRIRRSTPNDAEGMLHAHYSAVHMTAKKDYSDLILDMWSRPVDAQRIAAYLAKMETDNSVISFVAVDDSGQVLGFGELVPPETLGAIYVAAPAGRHGVASALYRRLEAEALDLGMKVLRMDSSLTAFSFYIKHGFRESERKTHPLGDGLTMACVRMEKRL